ncbi:hypothetical protein BJX63DRAFT_434393 [Aspergillus granulosus]|uniref:Uncharacterized protein n=1 Tax=Aspergillus granulosus TaxID=176169 RepID=A0ABR4H4T9_9EURO
MSSIEDYNNVDNEPPKEGFIEKILDHHHHEHGDKGQAAKDQPQGIWGEIRSDMKKNEAGLKEYLEKDEELEEEGKTYAGLM